MNSFKYIMKGKSYPTIQQKREKSKKLLIEFSPTVSPKIRKTETPQKLIVSKPLKKNLEITHRNKNEEEKQNTQQNDNKEQRNQNKITKSKNIKQNHQNQRKQWIYNYNHNRNQNHLYNLSFKPQNQNNNNNREESKLLPEFNHFEGNLEFNDFVPNEKYYYYFVSENVIPTRNSIKDRRLRILGLWDARDVQRFRYYLGTKNIYTFIGFETKEIREEAKNGKRIIYSVLNKSINNYPYKPYEINKASHIQDKEENENENENDEEEEHNKIITQNSNDDQSDDDEIEKESETEEEDDFFSDEDDDDYD